MHFGQSFVCVGQVKERFLFFNAKKIIKLDDMIIMLVTIKEKKNQGLLSSENKFVYNQELSVIVGLN